VASSNSRPQFAQRQISWKSERALEAASLVVVM